MKTNRKFKILFTILMLSFIVQFIFMRNRVDDLETKVNAVANTVITQALAPVVDDVPVLINGQTEQEVYAEQEKREEDARRAYEEDKKQWLLAHPPVKELFDTKRAYDTAYVIQYLQANPISGHCALVWRPDVVCMDGEEITFPTHRD